MDWIRLKFIAWVVIFTGFLSTRSISSELPWHDLSEEYALKHVYYVEDPKAQNLFGKLVIPFGEAHMTGDEGIAHYLEHLVASNAFPSDGEKFEHDYNATTSNFLTNYFMDSDESDRVLSYLSSVFAPIDLDQSFMEEERDIVMNEYQFRFAENSFLPIYQAAQDILFVEGPLTRITIGTPQDIESLTPERAIEIHEKYYLPQFASLILKGPEPIDEVEPLISQYFGDIKAKGNAPLIQKQEIVSGQIQKVISHPKNPEDHQVVTYIDENKFEKSAAQFAVDEAALQILESSKEGSLNHKLKFQDETVYSVSGYLELFPNDFGQRFSLSVRPKTLGDINLRLNFEDWVAHIANNSDKVEPILKNYIERETEDMADYTAKQMFNFLDWQISSGFSEIITPQSYIENLNAVTFDDVINYYHNIMDSKRIVEITIEGIKDDAS